MQTTVVLLAANVLVWTAERIPALRFRSQAWVRKYTTTDIAWFALALVAAIVAARLFAPGLQHLRLAPVSSAYGSIPRWSQILLAVVLYDLVAFTIHVFIHRSDTLWEVHKVHHSSLKLDGLATTRTHTMELLLRNVPAQAALFAIGASVGMVGTAVLVYGLFALFGHSNLDLPIRRLEALFITPRLHRLHHIPEPGPGNFGTIFSIWDRAFGSLVRRDALTHEQTGVPGEINSYPQRFLFALRAPFRHRVPTATRSTVVP